MNKNCRKQPFYPIFLIFFQSWNYSTSGNHNYYIDPFSQFRGGRRGIKTAKFSKYLFASHILIYCDFYLQNSSSFEKKIRKMSLNDHFRQFLFIYVPPLLKVEGSNHKVVKKQPKEGPRNFPESPHQNGSFGVSQHIVTCCSHGAPPESQLMI